MTLSIGMVTLDSTDPLSVGSWWAQQVGGEVVQENDGFFVVVSVPSGPMLAFQKVDDPTPGKNKMHLDLMAESLDDEVARLEQAGASVVSHESMDDFRWVTLSDPEGNLFDVAEASG